MKSIRKHLALIIALLIGCAAFTPLAMQPAEAAAKYDLPSKVTNYNYKKGKWVKESYSKLTYNQRGYLTKVSHSDGSKMSLKYSFYSNGKLKRITCPGGETFRFNSKGRATKYCLSSGGTFIKYSYRASLLYKYWDRDGDEAKYKYILYPDGSIKEMQLRFPGTPSNADPDAVTRFDENGLLTSEAEFNYTTFYRYIFDKKGRVKAVIVVYKDGNKEMGRSKYAFSYSKARSVKNKSRVNAVINTHSGTLNYGQTVAAGGGYMDAIRFILPTS